MKFLVLNELQVQNYKPIEKHIVISVRSPKQPMVKLPDNSNRKGAIFLEFHDIDSTGKVRSLYKISKEITPFNKTLALDILKFFYFFKNKVNLIVVNCEAGICRSSAIAGALAKINGQDDSEFFKRYMPNMLVYRTILEENYKCE